MNLVSLISFKAYPRKSQPAFKSGEPERSDPITGHRFNSLSKHRENLYRAQEERIKGKTIIKVESLTSRVTKPTTPPKSQAKLTQGNRGRNPKPSSSKATESGASAEPTKTIRRAQKSTPQQQENKAPKPSSSKVTENGISAEPTKTLRRTQTPIPEQQEEKTLKSTSSKDTENETSVEPMKTSRRTRRRKKLTSKKKEFKTLQKPESVASSSGEKVNLDKAKAIGIESFSKIPDCILGKQFWEDVNYGANGHSSLNTDKGSFVYTFLHDNDSPEAKGHLIQTGLRLKEIKDLIKRNKNNGENFIIDDSELLPKISNKNITNMSDKEAGLQILSNAILGAKLKLKEGKSQEINDRLSLYSFLYAEDNDATKLILSLTGKMAKTIEDKYILGEQFWKDANYGAQAEYSNGFGNSKARKRAFDYTILYDNDSIEAKESLIQTGHRLKKIKDLKNDDDRIYSINDSELISKIPNKKITDMSDEKAGLQVLSDAILGAQIKFEERSYEANDRLSLYSFLYTQKPDATKLLLSSIGKIAKTIEKMPIKIEEKYLEIE